MNKKALILLFSFLSILIIALLTACSTFDTEDYIRIHIRADSDSNADQSVKLAVRDEIVGYLSIKSNGVHSREEMLTLLEKELPNLELRANKVLSENGFDYRCKANIRREDFPERSYGELTLPEGNYLSLILELGSGQGQNWWCVAYPTLCFIASEDTDGDTVEYRSIIADFFNKLTENK